jgi:hypothetical protein
MRLVGVLVGLLVGVVGWGQTVTLPFSTSGTWVVPAGVNFVSVQVWGGGGGGGFTGNSSGAGGGGGGAYTQKSNIGVTPGTLISFTVGSGGTGQSASVSPAGNGGQSSILGIVANGGNGANGTTEGNGGTAGITGDVNNAGGNGGAGSGSNNTGGGGGGAGGPRLSATQDGGASTGAGGAGGTGTNGGGNGGGGGASSNPGAVGSTGFAPGGGGGGEGRSAANGGYGAPGQIILSYTCSGPNLSNLTFPTQTAVCQNSNGTITVNSTTLATKSNYQVYYTLSGANTQATPQLATLNFTAGSPGTGTFAITGLSNSGSTTVTLWSVDCASLTTGNTTTINVNALPTAFTVTGGGAYCSGATGVAVGLSGSQTGVNYQLKIGGANAGSAAGTGAAISFGTQTTAGTYTVVATNATTLCTNNMTGSATVTINSLPADPGNPTSNSPQCADVGVTLTQSGSAPGGETWYWQTTPGGTSTADNGLTYIAPTSGTYYIRSRNNTTGCWSSGAGSLAFTVNALPAGTLTAAETSGVANNDNIICTGANVTFTATAGFTNYDFRVNGSSVQNGAGNTYITLSLTGSPSVTVVVTNSNGCNNTFGPLTITVNTLPTLTNPQATICQGSTETLSPTSGGTWMSSNATIASITNAAVVTGNSAGSASFTFTNTTTGCASTTTATTVIGAVAAPSAPALVSGSLPICAGAGNIDFTVSTVANATSYTWSYTGSGVTGTGSGLGNTVTLNFSSTATPGNLTVVATNSCFTSAASTALFVSVTPLPGAAPAPTGPASVCQGVGDVTFLVGSPGFAAGATGYEWTLPDGSVVYGTASVTYNFTTSAATGIQSISVRGRNFCGFGPSATYNFTVNPLPVAAGTIAVTSPVCQGGVGYAFNVPAIDYATAYNWILPAGASIATGAGTNIITLNFTTGAATGTQTISVNGTNGCGSGVSSSNTFTVNPLPGPISTITPSATTVCQGQSGVTFSIAGVANATSYAWSVPTGASIVSGQGTTSITVNFASNAATGLQSVSVYAVNACGNGASNSRSITVDPLPDAPASLTTATATVCQGQNGVAYTVPAITNATGYVWTYSGTGATIIGTGNSITINFSTTATSGNLSVYGTNTCGNGPALAGYAITVNPLPAAAGTITGTGTVCAGRAGVAYSVPAISNATSYSWSYSGTGANITNGTSNNITIDFAAGATSGNLTVRGVNACGNGVVSANFLITISPIPTATVGSNITTCANTGAVNITGGATTSAGYLVWTTTSLGSDGTFTNAGSINGALFTPGANDISNGSVTIMLTVADALDCATNSYTKTLTISPLPTAVAGTVGPTCSTTGAVNITNGSSATNNASILWSGGLAGGWSNANSLTTATYTPSAADISAGSATLTLTAYGSGGCSAATATSTKTLTITKEPNPNFTYFHNEYWQCSNNAGPTNNPAITLGNITGTAGLVVNSGTGAINMLGSTAGFHTVTNTVLAANGCPEKIGTFSLTLHPSPAITPAPGTQVNQTVCVSALPISDIVFNVTSKVGTVTASGLPAGVSGSFNSGTGQFTITGTPSVSGTFPYTVTVTQFVSTPGGQVCYDGFGNILTYTATGTITVTPNATLSLTSGVDTDNQSVCTSGGTSFQNITYSLTGTNSYTFSGSLPAGLSHSLSGGVITISGSPTATGTYNYTITSNGTCGNQNLSGTIRVYSTAPATPSSITGPGGFCPPVNNLVYSVANDANVSNYIWTLPTGWEITSGEGTNSITVNVSGAAVFGAAMPISVLAKNGCNNASQNTTVAVNNFASVNAGADFSVCAGTAIPLSAVLGGSASLVTWSTTGTGTIVAPGSTSTSYNPGAGETGGTVTFNLITDNLGSCGAGTDQLVVTIRPALTGSIAVTGTNPICSGGSSAVRITGTPNAVTVYNNGTSDLTVTLNGSGIYDINTGSLTSSTTYTLKTVSYADAPACTISPNTPATVTVNQPAIVATGSYGPICQSNTPAALTLGGGSVTGGVTAGTWSIVSGGGGIVNNATPATSTYTPDAGYTGNVVLELTSDDPDGAGPLGPCPVESKQTTIFIGPNIYLDAGSISDICAAASPVAVPLTGATITSASAAAKASWGIYSQSPVSPPAPAAGTFTPGGQLTIPSSATFTPTAGFSGTAELWLNANAIAGSGCGESNAFKTITIAIEPTISAGPDQTVCGTGAVSITGATIGGGATAGTWTTSGTGSFGGTETSLTPTYTPSVGDMASGLVTLTFTTTNHSSICGVRSATKKLFINTPATITTGPDAIICSNGSLILSGASGSGFTSVSWATSNGGTFAPANALNPTYTPSISSGTANLTITTNDPDGSSGPCTAATDFLEVKVNQAATANAGANAEVCSNGTITLSGSIGGSASTYTWSASSGSVAPDNSSLAPVYTPAIASGTAFITLTTNDPDGGEPCEAAVSTITATVRPAATVSAGSNQAVCADQSVTLAGSVGGGATSGTWTAPFGTGTIINENLPSGATFTPSISSGTVTLTLTTDDPAGPCTALSDEMDVIVNVTPSIDDVDPQSVCNGSSTTAVNFTGNPTSGITYNWNNNNTSIGLALANGSGNIGSFTAINGTAAPVLATVTVTPVFGGCSGVSKDLVYTVNPTPVVDAIADQIRCNGEPTAAVTFNGAVSGTAFSWTNDNTTIGLAGSGNGNIASFAATNTGTTTQVANISVIPSANSCTGTSAGFKYTVYPTPTVNAVANQIYCNGVGSRTISFSGTVPGTVFNWTRTDANGSIGLGATSGSGDIVFNPTNATNAPIIATIHVTPQFAGLCNGTPTAFTITVNPTPTAAFTGGTNQFVCHNTSTAAITFGAGSTNVSGTVYNWTNNLTSIGLGASGTGSPIAVFTATNTGTTNAVATITVTPVANGCTGTSVTTNLTVYPQIVAPVASAIQTICKNTSANPFTGTAATGGFGSFTYQWQLTTDTTNPASWTNATGTGNTSLNYTPASPTVITFYRLRAINSTCTTPVYSNIVYVDVFDANFSNPNSDFKINGNSADNLRYCSNDNISVFLEAKTPPGLNGYIRFYWSMTGNPFVNPMSGGPVGTDRNGGWVDQTFNMLLSNNGDTTGTYSFLFWIGVYKNSDSSFLCNGPPLTKTIILNPRPRIVATVSAVSVCNNTPTTIQLTSNVLNPNLTASGVTFRWTSSVLSGTITGNTNNTTGIVATAGSPIVTISNTLVNSGSTAGQVRYTITSSATFPSGTGVTTCNSADTSYVYVTVFPNVTPGTVGSDQTICATGIVATLTELSAATGPGILSYQWQSSTTSGTGPWSDISGAIMDTYTPPANPTITTWYRRIVTSTTSSPAGSCSVAGSSVQITALAAGTPGVWTCAASNDWFDCRNWSDGRVPTNTTNVIIPTSAACNANIDPSTSPYAGAYGNLAQANNITIDGKGLSFGSSGVLSAGGNLLITNTAGSNVNMTAGGTINLGGNWTNQMGAGGLTAGAGTVNMVGSAPQSISSSAPQNFNNLIITNSSTTGVTLNNQVNVGGTFTLVNGIVNTSSTSMLNITNCNSNAVVGGANNTFVNGPMSRCTNSTNIYNYPVGNPGGPYGAYRPAQIRPSTSGVGNIYTAQYNTGAAPGANYTGSLGTLLGILQTEYWTVTSNNNTCPGNASVGLPYVNPNADGAWSSNTTGMPSTCTTCNVGVVKDDGGLWYLTDYPSYMGTGFNAGTPEYRYWTNSGTIWSKDVVGCDPANPYYSFGFTYNIILPIQLLTFDATLQGADALLKWTIADNKDVQAMEVEYSTDGRSFRRIGTVRPGATTAYDFVHPGLAAGTHYYRLLLKDINGLQKYSRIAIIVVGRPRTIITGLLGNPVYNEAVVEIISAKNQGVQTRIVDKAGCVVRSQRFTLQPGKNQVKVATLLLGSALYTLQVVTDDGIVGNLRMFKE